MDGHWLRCERAADNFPSGVKLPMADRELIAGEPYLTVVIAGNNLTVTAIVSEAVRSLNL